MIRDNNCRIDYEINTIAFAQATTTLNARPNQKRRRRPTARPPIDRHTGIYRRCGGERADSVDEHWQRRARTHIARVQLPRTAKNDDDYDDNLDLVYTASYSLQHIYKFATGSQHVNNESTTNPQQIVVTEFEP